jgi:hypothetical protein
MSIPDQQAMWDRKFHAGEHDRYREGVSDFARQMLEGAFTVITRDQGSQQTYGKQSDVLRCVAKEKRGKKLV